MNHRETSYFWPIPCGTWFATRVFISAWVPLLVFVICWHLKDLRLGLAFSGVFLVSLLFHEFGHVVAARMGGGSGDEILLWPFGGIAYIEPGPTLRSRLFTPAAGPLVNLILCGVTLKAVFDSGHTTAAFNPLEVPLVDLNADLLSALLVLVFTANWILLLINLLPVYPLDGGQILQTALSARFGSQAGISAYVRIGLAVGLIAMFVGLMLTVDGAKSVVFLGAIILLLNMHEIYRLQSGESYDESFMGYDFSQGYTSLERGETGAPAKRPGLLQRWRERRRSEKLRRKKEEDAYVQVQLDEILDKVHKHGIESLTVAERRLLNRASARFRQRDSDS